MLALASAASYSNTNDRGTRSHRRRVTILVRMSKMSLRILFQVDARLDYLPRATSFDSFKKHDKIKRPCLGLTRDNNLERLRWPVLLTTVTPDTEVDVSIGEG